MRKKSQIFKIIIFFIFFLIITGIFILSIININKLRNRTSSPNVLFILLDAARADHFSCYGYKKKTTPCIDEISKKGVIFLNNYSPATHTHGSLPKIFFSRYFSLPIFYSYSWGAWGVDTERPNTILKQYDSQQILLPEVLSINGYKTVLFSSHPWFAKDTYMVNKFDEHYSSQTEYNTPIVEKTILKINSWLEINKNHKFFLYWHIMSPHQPYPIKEEDKEFLKGYRDISIENVKEKINKLHLLPEVKLNNEELNIFKGLYDSNLKHTDRYIGLLYDKLTKLGLDNKTVIIITADHGEHLGDHGLLVHGDPPWDSVIHIPLIMVSPPVLPSGILAKGLTESIDIMPTILDILNIKLPKNKSMDGVSLLDFISNPDKGKKVVFTHDSIYTGIYKYIISKNLLYDLRKDPGEKQNIAKQNPELKEELAKKFQLTMLPYKKRYENSKRKDAPTKSFIFYITDFRIYPDEALEKCYESKINLAFLKKRNFKKPWLLNDANPRWGLIPVPKKYPLPPLKLSAQIPNGIYKVFIQFGSPDNIIPSLDKFRFRFSHQKPFISPNHLEILKTPQRDFFYFYLDLGIASIKKEIINIEIDFSFSDDDLFIMRHIKFTPITSSSQTINKSIDEEELRKKIESLKALGYIN